MNVSDTPSFDNPQKPKFLQKTSSFCSDFVIFFGGTLLAFLLIWSLWCLTSPPSPPSSFSSSLPSQPPPKPDPTTFYDDPDLGYTINTRVQNWDDKRKQWLNLHPEFSGSETERVVMVTGSQPKMFSYWAKYPVVKAAMIAHPEAEWIWWVDSDAFITDMDFNLPLEKYKTHNLIIHGWDHLVFQKKSWTGLNAGVFLIRNCQWSMDLLERWVKFGPSSPEYEKWGEIQKSIFKDKSFPEADDQTGIAYIMVKEGEKWNEKIYLEKEYYFEGYWLEIVDKLENITAYYSKIEKRERRLRRKNGEKAGKDYRAQWEEIREKEMGVEMKRPFITHFTGCEPCSGKHNEKYSREACLKGMNMALNFGDNQVLRNFGYFRPYLGNTSFVEPIRL